MSTGIIASGLCLVGLGLIVAGCWMAWPPLAFTVGGALLCAFGVFVHRQQKPKTEAK